MKLLLTTCLISTLALLSGCDRHDHGHDHAHGEHGHDHEHGDHGHHHEPPHGGAPVVLGDEAFHLEFVRDEEAGTLSAYVMDGHMENFVRLTNETIAIEVKLGEKSEALVMAAIENTATGETVGDTAHFRARAEWLLTTANFDAVIPAVEIRSQTFTNVAFSFPQGNE